MNILISLFPVILFLFFLVYLDSFKLVKKTAIFSCFLWGLLSAAAAYFINNYLLDLLKLEIPVYSRYISPWLEEILKASFLFVIIYKGKTGFMIDSAILGFAIGTGFAFMENIYYLNALQTDNLAVWIVRGFGTAVMHGGTTAVFGIMAIQTQDKIKLKNLLFGYLLAVLIHGLYNQFFILPVVSALAIFFALPIIIISIFQQNENSLKKWLEIEFDTEVQIIKMIKDGMFAETKIGKYVLSIKSRFTAEVVLDMLCYIRIYIELSIRAKSNLLLKESGFPVKKDPEISEKLKELNFLQRNIGKTGILAISPILRMNKKDVWKLNQLT
jgi:RsiW-degrading membrane proteinase PrsW (M82 family)